MEYLFFDVLPPLVSASKGNVALGRTACKLVDIVSLFHSKHHIVLDCKPDNLMIAQSPRVVTDDSVANSLRMVDLGLMKSFYEMGNHRDDTGTSEVQGTPLYASLNVHELHSPSRRDDMESFLYIIAEMVLIVNGLAKREDPAYGTGKDKSFLPWSVGKSDADIYKIKKKCVENRKSDFYQQMPSAAAGILCECLQLVRQLGFKKKPDYDSLRGKLANLSVPIPPKRASRKSKTPSPKKSRTTRSSAARKPPPEAIIEVESSDSDVTMEDVSSGDEEMLSSDEEVDVTQDSPKKPPLMQLVGLDSPIALGKGESIIIGSNPEVQGSALMVDDDLLSATHVRFDLGHIKSSIRVTPLLRSEILVEGLRVPRSGTLAFSGQKIELGNQQLTVKKVSKQRGDSTASVDENVKPAAKPRSSRAPRECAANPQDTPEAFIKISSGTQEGEVYPFTRNQRTMVVGSAPTGQGLHITLVDATDVEPNHATFVFSINKGTKMCTINNLKSSRGTFLNGKEIPKGKSGTAFCGCSRITIGEVTMELVRKT